MGASAGNCRLAGPKEVHESHPSVPQRLLHAQQDTIVFCPFWRAGNHHIAQPGKGSDRVFGIVVVPWHIVVIEKGEKLFSILFDPFFQCLASLCRAFKRAYVIEELFRGPFMLAQIVFF